MYVLVWNALYFTAFYRDFPRHFSIWGSNIQISNGTTFRVSFPPSVGFHPLFQSLTQSVCSKRTWTAILLRSMHEDPHCNRFSTCKRCSEERSGASLGPRQMGGHDLRGPGLVAPCGLEFNRGRGRGWESRPLSRFCFAHVLKGVLDTIAPLSRGWAPKRFRTRWLRTPTTVFGCEIGRDRGLPIALPIAEAVL